jgi:hypothetical protein
MRSETDSATTRTSPLLLLPSSTYSSLPQWAPRSLPCSTSLHTWSTSRSRLFQVALTTLPERTVSWKWMFPREGTSYNSSPIQQPMTATTYALKTSIPYIHLGHTHIFINADTVLVVWWKPSWSRRDEVQLGLLCLKIRLPNICFRPPRQRILRSSQLHHYRSVPSSSSNCSRACEVGQIWSITISSPILQLHLRRRKLGVYCWKFCQCQLS